MRMKPPRIRMRVHVCVCTRRQELKKGKTKKEEGSFSTREERHRLCDNVSKERCTMVFFFSPPPSLLSPHSLSRVSVFFFFFSVRSAMGFCFFFFFSWLSHTLLFSLVQCSFSVDLHAHIYKYIYVDKWMHFRQLYALAIRRRKKREEEEKKKNKKNGES